VDSTISLLTKH